MLINNTFPVLLKCWPASSQQQYGSSYFGSSENMKSKREARIEICPLMIDVRETRRIKFEVLSKEVWKSGNAVYLHATINRLTVLRSTFTSYIVN